MTNEQKQLLLKDLCARLPYKHYIRLETYNHYIVYKAKLNCRIINDLIKGTLIKIVPYLRPMSSMTEKEKKEYENARSDWYDDLETYDWLNAHHFDYRGLIPMGLALEAKEGMYKIE